MMMSPTLMPMRNTICLSAAMPALRPTMLRWISTAQRDRIDDAGEFHQHAVAGGLDDAAVVLGDAGVDQFAAVRFERRERADLVGAHQPAVADHIRR